MYLSVRGGVKCPSRSYDDEDVSDCFRLMYKATIYSWAAHTSQHVTTLFYFTHVYCTEISYNLLYLYSHSTSSLPKWLIAPSVQIFQPRIADFSPVRTGSADRSVRVWDMKSKKAQAFHFRGTLYYTASNILNYLLLCAHSYDALYHFFALADHFLVSIILHTRSHRYNFSCSLGSWWRGTGRWWSHTCEH